MDTIDIDAPSFGELFDELPLWSAPFGLMLLDRVPMRRGQTVLDIGAGTGFLTVELAERCGAEGRVIAVDPWAAAMARLARKVEQRGLVQVQLLQQDARTLPLPDASVDVIVSNLGVNNFDDPAAVMHECRRVARPGAAFVLTSNLAGHMAEFYDVLRQVLVDDGQHDRLPVLEAHVAHRATVASLTALLQDAGFGVDDVAQDDFRMRFADGTALLRHWFIRVGFVPGWATIPAAGREAATFERLAQALDAVARRRGELSLTVPMACVTARRRPAG